MQSHTTIEKHNCTNNCTHSCKFQVKNTISLHTLALHTIDPTIAKHNHTAQLNPTVPSCTTEKNNCTQQLHPSIAKHDKQHNCEKMNFNLQQMLASWSHR